MKPIVFFDTETTGTNICRDKIVELYMVKFSYDEHAEQIAELHLFFNPGFPMPQAAFAVHGISDEQLVDKPTFTDKAKEILEFIDDCYLCGHNSIKFDILLLAEEFANAGIEWVPDKAKLLDTLNTERALTPHNLIATYHRYFGHDYMDDFGKAHGAKADTLATEKVFERQVIAVRTTFDAEGIEKYRQFSSKGDIVDLGGYLSRNADGVIVYAFGKNNGKSVKSEPGYAFWMQSQDFPADTKRCLRDILSNKLV